MFQVLPFCSFFVQSIWCKIYFGHPQASRKFKSPGELERQLPTVTHHSTEALLLKAISATMIFFFLVAVLHFDVTLSEALGLEQGVISAGEALVTEACCCGGEGQGRPPGQGGDRQLPCARRLSLQERPDLVSSRKPLGLSTWYPRWKP